MCSYCKREPGELLVSPVDPVCLEASLTAACLAGVVQISAWGAAVAREPAGRAICGQVVFRVYRGTGEGPEVSGWRM